MFRCGYVSGPVFFIICLDQHVYLNKACARATSDWVIGCLAVAEDWTERVPLDLLFREAVIRVGLCITWMGELCLISFKSRQ